MTVKINNIYLIVLRWRKEKPAGRPVSVRLRANACSLLCVCARMRLMCVLGLVSSTAGENTPDFQRVWDCTYSVASWKVWIFSTAVLEQYFTFSPSLSSYSWNSSVSFIKESSQFTDSQITGLAIWLLSFERDRDGEKE